MKIESEQTTEKSGNYSTNYLLLTVTLDWDEVTKVKKYIELDNIIKGFYPFCKENNFPFITSMTDPEGTGPYNKDGEKEYGWTAWVDEKHPILQEIAKYKDQDRDCVTIEYKDLDHQPLKLPDAFYCFVKTSEYSWMSSWC
jgi:hypothetical protein